MIIGVEHLQVLEKYAKMQIPIYPGEACDTGIHLLTPDAEKVLDRIREACKGLAKDFAGKANKWTGGSAWSCFVPFEQEDGVYTGVRVVVSVQKIGGRGINRHSRFVSIDLHRTSQTANPFRTEGMPF